jgi:hypothetical protein
VSYVIHVWEAPIPRSFDEAEKFVDTPPPETDQNPLFITLAAELTARYPCGMTLEDPDDSVWTDGPFDGKLLGDIWVIGITTQHLSEALPFTVATANNLGLTVYDMQEGKAYLPSGEVLVPMASKPWWKVW